MATLRMISANSVRAIQEELKCKLLDLVTGVVLPKAEFPWGVPRNQMIALGGVLDRPELRELLIKIAHAQLQEIREKTPFDFFVATEGNAVRFFAHLAQIRGAIREPVIPAVSRGVSGGKFSTLALPPNGRVLLLTDLISTGVVCRHLISTLCPRPVVGIQTMLQITGDDHHHLQDVPITAGVTLSFKEIGKLAPGAKEQIGGELLFDASPIGPKSRPIVLSMLDDVKRYFAAHPEKMRDLPSRKFEELVADLLKDMGLEVELTKATRDGGVDIYAHLRHAVGEFLMLVECKKWSANRPVGVEIVRQLFGVQQTERANKSLIVTTSFFTQPAKNEAAKNEHMVELKDFEALRQWLARYRTKKV